MEKTKDKWLTDFFSDLYSPKDKEIAQRLINNSVSMQSVYDEINKKLYNPYQKYLVMQAIIDAAVLYGQDIRSEKKTQDEKENEIARKANELAYLIEKYKCQNSRFKREIPDSLELIDIEGGCNPYYELQFKNKINELMKVKPLYYTSTIEGILRCLATELSEYGPWPTILDNFDNMVLQSQKHTYLDFIRALWARLEESKESNGGLLPNRFKLSYRAIGDIANNALNYPKFTITEEDVSKGLKNIKLFLSQKAEDFDLKKV